MMNRDGYEGRELKLREMLSGTEHLLREYVALYHMVQAECARMQQEVEVLQTLLAYHRQGGLVRSAQSGH